MHANNGGPAAVVVVAAAAVAPPAYSDHALAVRFLKTAWFHLGEEFFNTLQAHLALDEQELQVGDGAQEVAQEPPPGDAADDSDDEAEQQEAIDDEERAAQTLFEEEEAAVEEGMGDAAQMDLHDYIDTIVQQGKEEMSTLTKPSRRTHCTCPPPPGIQYSDVYRARARQVSRRRPHLREPPATSPSGGTQPTSTSACARRAVCSLGTTVCSTSYRATR